MLAIERRSDRARRRLESSLQDFLDSYADERNILPDPPGLDQDEPVGCC